MLGLRGDALYFDRALHLAPNRRRRNHCRCLGRGRGGNADRLHLWHDRLVATLGAAGVEVAQGGLVETQSAILPLVPYLDMLRWVFIAVALGGIAVTIYARLDDWRRGQR